jgi:hypothetical protein
MLTNLNKLKKLKQIISQVIQSDVVSQCQLAANGKGLALLGDLENFRPEPKLMRC